MALKKVLLEQINKMCQNMRKIIGPLDPNDIDK